MKAMHDRLGAVRGIEDHLVAVRAPHTTRAAEHVPRERDAGLVREEGVRRVGVLGCMGARREEEREHLARRLVIGEARTPTLVLEDRVEITRASTGQARDVDGRQPLREGPRLTEVLVHVSPHDRGRVVPIRERTRHELGTEIDVVENDAVTKIGPRALARVHELVDRQIALPCAALSARARHGMLVRTHGASDALGRWG